MYYKNMSMGRLQRLFFSAKEKLHNFGDGLTRNKIGDELTAQKNEQDLLIVYGNLTDKYKAVFRGYVIGRCDGDKVYDCLLPADKENIELIITLIGRTPRARVREFFHSLPESIQQASGVRSKALIRTLKSESELLAFFKELYPDLHKIKQDNKDDIDVIINMFGLLCSLETPDKNSDPIVDFYKNLPPELQNNVRLMISALEACGQHKERLLDVISKEDSPLFKDQNFLIYFLDNHPQLVDRYKMYLPPEHNTNPDLIRQYIVASYRYLCPETNNLKAVHLLEKTWDRIDESLRKTIMNAPEEDTTPEGKKLFDLYLSVLGNAPVENIVNYYCERQKTLRTSAKALDIMLDRYTNASIATPLKLYTESGHTLQIEYHTVVRFIESMSPDDIVELFRYFGEEKMHMELNGQYETYIWKALRQLKCRSEIVELFGVLAELPETKRKLVFKTEPELRIFKLEPKLEASKKDVLTSITAGFLYGANTGQVPGLFEITLKQLPSDNPEAKLQTIIRFIDRLTSDYQKSIQLEPIISHMRTVETYDAGNNDWQQSEEKVIDRPHPDGTQYEQIKSYKIPQIVTMLNMLDERFLTEKVLPYYCEKEPSLYYNLLIARNKREIDNDSRVARALKDHYASIDRSVRREPVALVPGG